MREYSGEGAAVVVGAVVVEVVEAGEVVEVVEGPEGRVVEVLVVPEPNVVDVLLLAGAWVVVVSKALVTPTASAATSGDPSGSASSVTCDRTDPTAAEAITTATRVAPIHAATNLNPMFIPTIVRRFSSYCLNAGINGHHWFDNQTGRPAHDR